MDHHTPKNTLTRLFLTLCMLSLAAIPLLHHLSLSCPTLDPAILDRIHTHATLTLTILARTLSAIGSPRTIWPVTILLATILWLRRHRRPAYLLALTMAAAGSLESLVKLLARRPRPTVPWAYVHENTYSFPSGHATLAIALYGILLWINYRTPQPRWLRIAALLLSVTLIPTIGLSRLYLGAHYPTDVLAGYLTGAATLFLILAADIAL